MTSGEHVRIFERLYCDLNHRRYVHPDPLEFLYGYDSPGDREVAALVAGSLAYGRVAQILTSVAAVLELLGPSPADYLARTTSAKLRRALVGFRHRFATGEHVAAMLSGAGRAIERFGSLEGCFAAGLDDADETVLPALQQFVDMITQGGDECGHLLPDPSRGSACKRLNLMLRWLVRRDAVDPGGWSCVAPAKLIVPLDTHMHQLSRKLGLTARKAADMRTAMEITDAFRRVSPDDPVRYDFALTRLGIRSDIDAHAFLGSYVAALEIG